MHISYRPDIDGLRAVAVLLVVFNHIGWTLFPGGYVGVDIFFVISGFLISVILRNEIEQQQFSIGNFYKRRVLRLAPAYFVVLSVVSGVSLLVLFPTELLGYFKSLLYATFLMANIYMAQEVGDYFSGDVDQVPLLHLWSLGVEEQFYVVWPLLLLVLLRKGNAKKVAWSILALIFVSVAYAQYSLNVNFAKAYFSMPVRAFELLSGALLAFLPRVRIADQVSRLLVYLALVVIFTCAMLFDKTTKFPGLLALFPCLATALILYCGAAHGDRTNAFLSHPLSVSIGKISYPLYLWHWPIIVFCGLVMLPQTAIFKVAIVVVAMLLAYATYYWIEQPCKKLKHYSPLKVIAVGFFVPALLLSGFMALAFQQKGFPQRFAPEMRPYIQAMNIFAHDVRAKCHNFPSPEELPSPEQCVLGIKNKQIDFLMVGDSHANHFTGMVDVWAKAAGLRGYDVTEDTTLFLPNVNSLEPVGGKKFEQNGSFTDRNEAISEHLKNHRYRFVILAGHFNGYFRHQLTIDDQPMTTDQAYLVGMRTAIQQVKAAGATPVILLDTPELFKLKAECPLRAAVLHLNQPCQVSYQEVQQKSQKFMQLLQRLKLEFPELVLIDPKRVICTQQSCEMQLNHVPLYRAKDWNHLNYVGSQELGKVYLQKFGNPLIEFRQ